MRNLWGVYQSWKYGFKRNNLQAVSYTHLDVYKRQPMLKIDRAKIAAAGYKDCVVVAVSNTAEFADVELAVEADSAVAAGDAIVKVVRK